MYDNSEELKEKLLELEIENRDLKDKVAYLYERLRDFDKVLAENRRLKPTKEAKCCSCCADDDFVNDHHFGHNSEAM